MLLDKYNNWLDSSISFFTNGFTDTQLENLCSLNRVIKSPILFWSTELYGFGKCYRNWLGISKFFPIPFYGDHGVDLTGILHPHEKYNKSKYHLTFSKARVENLNNYKFKKLLYIQNPWVTYRKEKSFQLKKIRQGTLIFFAHTNVGIDFENNNFDLYFNQLSILDKDFGPFVICLHKTDIQKGLHKNLRKFGYPIITAGDTLDPNFVDRFYEIIINFKQATSNKIGSYIFYCTEIGLPFFLYGDIPGLINKSDKNIPLGDFSNFTPILKKFTNEIYENYSIYSPSITDSQLDLTNKTLGLDANFNKNKLRKFFILESIRLTPYFIFLILRKLKTL
jgi:hypothetical protein